MTREGRFQVQLPNHPSIVSNKCVKSRFRQGLQPGFMALGTFRALRLMGVAAVTVTLAVAAPAIRTRAVTPPLVRTLSSGGTDSRAEAKFLYPEVSKTDRKSILEIRSGLFVQQAADTGKKAHPNPASGTKTPGPAPPAAVSSASEPHVSKATLSDFAWLEGRWQGVWGPRVVEQIWMPPRAGEMLALLRVTENGTTLVIELFSLVATPDGVELRFRHFTPELGPWEPSGPTAMKLVEFDAKSAVFENSAPGQPKRSVFTRLDLDNYTAKSEIVPEAADAHVTEIRYHRQK
jgi:hypothetical protein